MQVILDSSFARLGSAPIWGGKKGEFRDWTRWSCDQPQPGSFFQRPREAEKRDPGNEVGLVFVRVY